MADDGSTTTGGSAAGLTAGPRTYARLYDTMPGVDNMARLFAPHAATATTSAAQQLDRLVNASNSRPKIYLMLVNTANGLRLISIHRPSRFEPDPLEE